MGNTFSFTEAYFKPAKKEEDFADMDNATLFTVLRSNQVGIISFIFFNALIDILICIAAVVPGFALFDGAAGEVSAISHIGWWMAIELLVLVIGSMSVFFTLHLTRNGQIEYNVAQTRGWLWFYVGALCVAILANITHLVLSSIELVNCTSTLCTQYQGFLIALIALLAVLAIIQGWQIYRVVTYNLNILRSLGRTQRAYAVDDLQQPLVQRKARVRRFRR